MQAELKDYKINEKLLGSTLSYLASRPLAEVFDLFNALRSLSPCEPEKSEGLKDAGE